MHATPRAPAGDPAAGELTWEERVRRRQDRRRAIRRRRLVVVVGLTGLIALVAVVLSIGGSDAGAPAHAHHLHKLALRPPAPLPRGGTRLLPGHLIVAYYGIVGTSNVLGHDRDAQADAAGVERVAREYAGYGLPVQPAFELVTTIASPTPGADGTYSSPVDPAILDRYLQAAHRHKLLLILDFQPGRGQFLPQIKRYARVLRDPAVGVALDPEWKITDDEVPTQTIGSSSASGINAVSAYLSRLVRRDRLPQKLFIVHEFRLSELPDRGAIRFAPGLATILQMDGLGTVATKLAAYHQVQHAALGFHPGFKVFLRPTDDPVQLRPARIMKLRPRPQYISYQ